MVSSLDVYAQEVNKNHLTGKIDYRLDVDFVKLDPEHAAKTLYLRKETYAAFVEMYNAAKKDGIELRIISGTRNFEEQKKIWEKKWNTHSHIEAEERTAKILEFSSMPATSRHHWGTEVDLNHLQNDYYDSGKGKKEYEWLSKNAEKFGFFQVYSSQEVGRPGYSEEKWHWSYLPLANHFLKMYNIFVNYSDISDFDGANLAEECRLIENYVNGISPNFPQKIVLTTLPSEELPGKNPEKKIFEE